METIKLHFKFNKQKFLLSNRLRWKIGQRQYLKNETGMLLFAVVFVLLGLGNESYLFITIGLTLLGLLLYSFLFLLKQKQAFKKQLNKLAEEFENTKMDCDYEFTETEVKYSDKEKKIEYQWHLINGYEIYKEHLVLFVNDAVVNMYIFDLKDVEEETKINLLKLIKEKVKMKK